MYMHVQCGIVTHSSNMSYLSGFDIMHDVVKATCTNHYTCVVIGHEATL